MTVTLTTRCGCKRELNLPLPLPEYIVLPLSRSTSLFHLEMQTEALEYPDLKTRRFIQYGSTQHYMEAE